MNLVDIIRGVKLAYNYRAGEELSLTDAEVISLKIKIEFGKTVSLQQCALILAKADAGADMEKYPFKKAGPRYVEAAKSLLEFVGVPYV